MSDQNLMISLCQYKPRIPRKMNGKSMFCFILLFSKIFCDNNYDENLFAESCWIFVCFHDIGTIMVASFTALSHPADSVGNRRRKSVAAFLRIRSEELPGDL